MRYAIDTPLGTMIAGEEKGSLRSLRFAGEGESAPAGETELALRLKNWLAAYAAGRPPETDLPLEPEGTDFQKRVWRAACEIPYGETRSYGELARAIGCGSARAVGAALGKNPVWILIPCHRVVGKNGALTGYAGGLDRKRSLLEHERREKLPANQFLRCGL